MMRWRYLTTIGLLALAVALCLSGCKQNANSAPLVYSASVEDTWNAVRRVVRSGATSSYAGVRPYGIIADVNDQEHWLVTKWFFGGKEQITDPFADKHKRKSDKKRDRERERYRYSYYRARITCTASEAGTQVQVRIEGESYESEYETGPSGKQTVSDSGANWSKERFLTELNGILGEPNVLAKAGTTAPAPNKDAPKPEAK